MESFKKEILTLFFGSILMLTSIIAAAATSKAIVVDKINSMQWRESAALPGVKIAYLVGDPDQSGFFVVRYKLPAHYKIDLHSHPINEYATVLSGMLSLELHYASGQVSEVTLNANSFVMIPKDLNHIINTTEETILQVSGIGPLKSNFEEIGNKVNL